MATERGIIFNGPMVRAILEGRKTQTRRIVKAEHHYIGGRDGDLSDPSKWGFADMDGCWHVLDQSSPAWTGGGRPNESYAITCPHGCPGDRLWVRERWSPYRRDGAASDDIRSAESSLTVDGGVRFRDGAYYPGLQEYAPGAFDGIKWRPSIHMPRWASRITLEVTGVRVERLQDISEVDALAEGIAPLHGPLPCVAYAELWDQINGKRAPWASNPWVWAVSFRRMT